MSSAGVGIKSDPRTQFNILLLVTAHMLSSRRHGRWDVSDKFRGRRPWINEMSMRYNIIYADPPWSYDDKCLHRGGAERHYRTMDLKDICALPINDLAASDCLLFMWATFPKLWEAKDVFSAWGFEYKTCAFVWIKTNKREVTEQASFFPVDSFDSFWGMGRWTRSNAEICLLGTKGQPKRQSGGVHQIIYAPISEHSAKPAETRTRIVELAGDLPRVELFARKSAEGWDCWGNEVESTCQIEPQQQEAMTFG